ncbi:MAG: shikimate dehydrogenase [Elusimicrobia bacterium]|nr:shikimate dehydrogenase [Elusimicrobiota bacterium]
MGSSKTKLLGIFGYPIGHSLSPLMHNAVIKKMRLEYVYLPFEVHPSRLKTAVNSINNLNIAGINVTIPHKENIIKYLNKVSDVAARIGAVNTVVNRNGFLTGYNTDYYGFLKTIQEFRSLKLKNKSVLMLGCGGVAKAIVFALIISKIKKLIVSDVDAKAVKKFLQVAYKINNNRCKIIGIKKDEIRKYMFFADLFINATPVGMKEKDPSPVSKNLLKKEMFIYDVIYNRKTQLLKDAETIGANFKGGLDMLVYQAAKSFELWTGKKPPVELMKKVLKKKLLITNS